MTEGCSPPATPRDRVPRCEAVISGTKTAPSKRRATLDQVELLHTIRGNSGNAGDAGVLRTQTDVAWRDLRTGSWPGYPTA